MQNIFFWPQCHDEVSADQVFATAKLLFFLYQCMMLQGKTLSQA